MGVVVIWFWYRFWVGLVGVWFSGFPILGFGVMLGVFDCAGLLLV